MSLPQKFENNKFIKFPILSTCFINGDKEKTPRANQNR